MTVRKSGPGAWVAAATATVGGVLLGVLTNLAQGWLPGDWNQLANSAAVWSAVAFAAGALIARRGTLLRAALGGLGAETGLVAGYYGYAEFGRDGMGALLFPLVWLAMACVAGPLFGVAAYAWRRGRGIRSRTAGLAAFAGLFGMEAMTAARDLHHTAQAWTCGTAFLLIPLLMAPTHRVRALTLAAAVPCALLAYAIVGLPLKAVSS
ncbi:DUF6518 family protein [Streptantibioticus cattleyicolor]|uniref:Uncharacterized protein n=1 Tax=Streptantibioticus cattleyicolor (strain ATCC 35852 / DSM 46488 / JCM 4925 / NBRC 14057 / NRRL 8057) TaxID=1003195 RepID=G8XH05_STREN|nr:DUF6518 family protein [Streptantibioticus cattleyicolor]AEW99723.1 hypothetical protein SCATT_p15300 [Streptantibioticus cattleyicolor NRRL 8057 = DSM 46488]